MSNQNNNKQKQLGNGNNKNDKKQEGDEEVVQIMGGPMGGRITVRKIITPLNLLDDDEDDIGIPPEILAMMRMTE